jgi:hypothetical protein
MIRKHRVDITLLAVAIASIAALASAGEKAKITSPKEQFGFQLGDDYCLANYQQLLTYWRKLERESDRMKVEVIGESEEGREMVMAILTSPKNLARLDRYREISRRLARAEGLSAEESRKLAAEGKAVVWIDGGLHGTEVLGAQQLMETVYQMVSRDDAEMQRFLRDVIVLCCCVNPDGLDLVADWYMRESNPKKRSSSGLPRLYQKYIGHDDNRDFLMVTQKESEAVCRVLYQQWFPQIVYNHHQSGPAGTVMFAPPFRDPFNYHFDPLIPLGIDLVGAAMHGRFAAEGKPGTTMRKSTGYSTWWNGGLRTDAYFHNMIGLLTETIGHPTPMEIPLKISKQLPSADLPFPIAPQKWRFRQSVEYELTANWAVVDVAARYREQLLVNIYQMGRNSIDRGNRDYWTMRPGRIEAAERASQRTEKQAERQKEKEDQSEIKAEESEKKEPQSGKTAGKKVDIFKSVLHDPAERDPRGYILPIDQPDFPTATKFVNTLLKNGVTVHRATAAFEVAGKDYAKGSYVVQCAQAFRPYVLDVFEPQNHPHDVAYPGGPPIPPYDIAGWTPAYQMGVQFDRVLDGFSGPFEPIEGLAKPPAGSVQKPESAAGFLLDRAANDSFVVVNRLLGKQFGVQRLQQPIEREGTTYPAGTWYIPNDAKVLPVLRQCAEELGLTFVAVDKPFRGERTDVGTRRVGLWDRYGGSMESGWTRWILEHFEFNFKLVFSPELDKGSLKDRYDVLILPSGAVSGTLRNTSKTAEEKSIPEEYRGRSGSISADKTLPQLKAFLESGGVIVTIGDSTALARHLKTPVRNALVEMDADGHSKPLTSDKFYVPGSLLRVRLDTTSQLTAGMPEHVDVCFRRSPAFRLGPEAVLQGIRPAAWFDSESPLRSGWAWGQQYLYDTIAVAEVPIGKGCLLLYGPEIAMRAAPHGTFKLLFNGIYYQK